MGYSYYSYLVLLTDESDFSLAELAARLEHFYGKAGQGNVAVVTKEESLKVKVGDYAFQLHYNQEDYVVEESQEIAEDAATNHPDKARIAACRRRLEIAGEDDPDMDYFNDSLYLLEIIETFSGVFIFDPYDGRFLSKD